MRRSTFGYGLCVLALGLLPLLASDAAAVESPQPSETAVLSGELPDGATIPLPTFANGDTASEDQCRWIVSPRIWFGNIYYDSCYTTGRTVHIADPTEGPTAVNYMILATRPIPPPTFPPPSPHRMVAYSGHWAVDSDGNVYDTILPKVGSQCDVGTLTAHFLGNMFGGPPPSPIVAVGDALQTGQSVLLENGDLYYWCDYNTPPPGYAVRAGNIFSAAGISAVGQSTPAAGNAQSLNRPNPFNPATEIPYRIGAAGHVVIQVFDGSGRLVRTIEDAQRGPGRYVARWDGRTDSGMDAASGTYFARIVYPDGSRSEGKMTIAR